MFVWFIERLIIKILSSDDIKIFDVPIHKSKNRIYHLGYRMWTRTYYCKVRINIGSNVKICVTIYLTWLSPISWLQPAPPAYLVDILYFTTTKGLALGSKSAIWLQIYQFKSKVELHSQHTIFTKIGLFRRSKFIFKPPHQGSRRGVIC